MDEPQEDLFQVGLSPGDRQQRYPLGVELAEERVPGIDFYLAMSECVLRVAGFAEFAEQTADAVGDALVTAGFAAPAAFFGVVGELPLQAQAFAARVLGCPAEYFHRGDEPFWRARG